jgi:hypothetical protein
VSVYFDTLDLASYREKRGGDYLKTKWRARWYRVDGTVMEPAFVERKDRVGTRRRKRRAIAPLPACALDETPLAALRPAELLRPLLAAHEAVPAALLPCLRLAYDRRRFHHAGLRVAFDTEIRAVAVHPRLGPLRDPRPLPVAVVEVKGEVSQPPRWLDALGALGARRRSFSKYGDLLDRQGWIRDRVA